ncbi:hypothetical protein SAMN05216267_104827 [Actinacidiphila rubida]|uniref:CU044_5270 family protein n=1 Tax=Actinacidiphila rubida TaxID=310780 RepID=A0A1H8T6A6_9ACTN|nr:hypothetical protein [Actinacidiphila rubida]SEO86246.1 hypothetical protein SAMN05216267_104827 [Actinacidiphila rubida]
MTEPSPHDPPFPGWDELVAAGTTPAADPAVLAAARTAVADAVRRDTAPFAAAAAAPAAGAAHDAFPPSRPRPRRRGPALRVSLTALAAAAAVVVTVSPLSASHHATPRAAAPGTVTSTFLADVASAQSIAPGTWDDAPYWKVAFTRFQADGQPTGVLTEFLAHRAGLTSHLRAAAPVEEDKPAPGPWRFTVGTGRLTWDQLAGLPTAPTALRARLRPYAEPGQDPSEEIFGTIGDLLASPAPPKVRAALFEVAARLPGVRVAGPATDGSGRHGTAVERGDGTIVVRYVIDPTGRLLETVVSSVHALPALPASAEPRSLGDMNGVTEGRRANGSRPPVPAGGVVERTTYTFIGPATRLDGP